MTKVLEIDLFVYLMYRNRFMAQKHYEAAYKLYETYYNSKSRNLLLSLNIDGECSAVIKECLYAAENCIKFLFALFYKEEAYSTHGMMIKGISHGGIRRIFNKYFVRRKGGSLLKTQVFQDNLKDGYDDILDERSSADYGKLTGSLHNAEVALDWCNKFCNASCKLANDNYPGFLKDLDYYIEKYVNI